MAFATKYNSGNSNHMGSGSRMQPNPAQGQRNRSGSGSSSHHHHSNHHNGGHHHGNGNRGYNNPPAFGSASRGTSSSKKEICRRHLSSNLRKTLKNCFQEVQEGQYGRPVTVEGLVASLTRSGAYQWDASCSAVNAANNPEHRGAKVMCHKFHHLTISELCTSLRNSFPDGQVPTCPCAFMMVLGYCKEAGCPYLHPKPENCPKSAAAAITPTPTPTPTPVASAPGPVFAPPPPPPVPATVSAPGPDPSVVDNFVPKRPLQITGERMSVADAIENIREGYTIGAMTRGQDEETEKNVYKAAITVAIIEGHTDLFQKKLPSENKPMLVKCMEGHYPTMFKIRDCWSALPDYDGDNFCLMEEALMEVWADVKENAHGHEDPFVLAALMGMHLEVHLIYSQVAANSSALARKAIEAGDPAGATPYRQQVERMARETMGMVLWQIDADIPGFHDYWLLHEPAPLF